MAEVSLEIRSVIKFLTKEAVPPKEIHERLLKVYNEQSPSYSAIKRWAQLFRFGRESLEDDPKSGRPVTAATPEKIDLIEKLVMANRRLKILEIAAEVGLSCGSVEKVLHENLHLSKVCARWVPRNLNAFDRARRVTCSTDCLTLYNADEKNFLDRIVTGDETWVHHWDPETKHESMQWKHRDSPPPVKFRTQSSAGKMMATIFWDSKGILMIDYLPGKTTMNGPYYAELMKKLRAAIKEKRRGKLTRGILLLHDNAPVHTSHVAAAAIRECGFEQINHPPYSPDLAPSDFYLFSNLKKHLRGKRFEDDNEVISAVKSYFDDQPESFFCRV
jgi:[histone H3]-lysine36 N-dimethyltransferase SETMAR